MSTSELTGINHRARGKALKTTRNLDLLRLDQNSGDMLELGMV